MVLNPDTQFLVIKLYEDKVKDFRDRLRKGIENTPYYICGRTDGKASKEDTAVFRQLARRKEYRCAFVDFKVDADKKTQTITKIYWTVVWSDGHDLACTLKHEITDEVVIAFFEKSLIGFDLVGDYGGEKSHRYIYFDANPELVAAMERSNQKKAYQVKRNDQKPDYSKLTYKTSLDPLAQRPEYCIRHYEASAVVGSLTGKGTNFARYDYRKDEFARDYDAIVSSKAYRRMVDKAQLFSAARGVHYRTRMTHTQVVCYIARRICDNLGLNSRLAEAIAVGHDLGHTPFGHQGERTLQDVLEGKYDVLPMERGPALEERLADLMEQELSHNHTIIVGNCMAKTVSKDDILAKLAAEAPVPRFVYGGFKHNYQSVRVAAALETMCPEFDGLNLSAQTLNGMWLHTKAKPEIDIKDFAGGFEQVYQDDAGEVYEVPFTLEGQVVAAADEIAQRSHDIEDAFSSGLVTVDDLCAYIFPKKAKKLREPVEKLRQEIQDLKAQHRLFADEEDTLCVGISTIIVDYFINQICVSTRENMKAYKKQIAPGKTKAKDIFDVFKNQRVIKEKLVGFSKDDKALCSRLENFVNDNVLKSDGVQLFDSNGGNVVLALFKAYYNNPLLLHAENRRRIWNQYLEQGLESLDISELDYFALKDKWKAITRNPKTKADEEKHKILVRAICDYISGMTDSNAMNEYHKIIHQP